MEKIIYYTLYDAECAAMAFEDYNPGAEIRRNSNGGYDYGRIDDSEDAEEDDRFVRNVGCWSGELPAIVVVDKAGQIIGKFAYWDDEID